MDSNVDVLHRLGRVLQERGQLGRAEKIYRDILKIEPNYFRSLNNLAVLLTMQERFFESQVLLDEGLSQAADRWHSDPLVKHSCLAEEWALLLNTRSQLAMHMDEFETARCLIKLQVQLNPQLSGFANLGIALGWLNKSAASRRSHWLSLGCASSSRWPPDPDSTFEFLWIEEESPSSSASRHLQICNLATGVLSKDPLDRDAWQMLLSRLATDPSAWVGPARVWHGLWKGEPLDHLLVWDEQGYGDAIQCFRWLLTSSERVKSLTVLLRPTLVELVKQRLHLPSNCVVKPFDIFRDRPWAMNIIHCPLMALPVALYPHGSKIPLATTSIFKTPIYIKDRERRFGLVWAAGPKNNPEAHRSARLRSMSGELLIRHSLKWSINWQAKLYSLQLGSEAEEVQPWISAGIVTVLKPGGDWLATSRLVEQLDVVITVDTAMVHLAGSLGVPCILLLNQVCDWRWWSGGQPVPWYPSVTVIRASALNDWEGLMEKVPHLLNEILIK